MSFDMNQCKIGDMIVSKHGMILVYEGYSGLSGCLHQVRYPDGGRGSRYDDGSVFRLNKLASDHDIIAFAKDYYSLFLTDGYFKSNFDL